MFEFKASRKWWQLQIKSNWLLFMTPVICVLYVFWLPLVLKTIHSIRVGLLRDFSPFNPCLTSYKSEFMQSTMTNFVSIFEKLSIISIKYNGLKFKNVFFNFLLLTCFALPTYYLVPFFWQDELNTISKFGQALRE